MIFFNRIRRSAIIIIALSISLFYCNMKTNAQEKWYKPINIGQHNLNFVAEKKVDPEEIRNYFQDDADNIYSELLDSELSKLMNEWEKDDAINPSRDFKNDPYFNLIKDRKLEYAIAGFSDKKVNVLFFFTYGFSRWHRYNAILENLILPRNEMVDSILNMKYFDDLYKTEYKEVRHGTTMVEAEEILGDDYYEYLGQSMQLRNIYYQIEYLTQRYCFPGLSD